MNRMPLPIHLLTDIPGYGMLGQTSFGGFYKIIITWWQTGCPPVEKDTVELWSISGMRSCDYERYKPKLEPVLYKAFETLRKYRDYKIERRANVDINLYKAHQRKREILAEKRKAALQGQKLVEKDKKNEKSGVSFSPIEEDKVFHEGWNLHKSKWNTPEINKKTTPNASLFDK